MGEYYTTYSGGRQEQGFLFIIFFLVLFLLLLFLYPVGLARPVAPRPVSNLTYLPNLPNLSYFNVNFTKSAIQIWLFQKKVVSLQPNCVNI